MQPRLITGLSEYPSLALTAAKVGLDLRFQSVDATL